MGSDATAGTPPMATTPLPKLGRRRCSLTQWHRSARRRRQATPGARHRASMRV
jgi:hypothetical protein